MQVHLRLHIPSIDNQDNVCVYIPMHILSYLNYLHNILIILVGISI